VFGVDSVNIKFNNFLNTYLRCYYSSFVKINVSKFNQSHNEWITKGLKSPAREKKNSLCYVVTNNYNLKLYYKKYCSLLTKVIRNAKKLHYNNIILRSKNKMRSTWKIINNNIGTTQHDMSVPSLVMNEKIMSKKEVANIFNNYFLSVADSVNVYNNKAKTSSMINPINYLFKHYSKPFADVNW